MSYRYIVDSSAWIEYFSGSDLGKAIKEIIEGENLACSIIVIAELADKFYREKKSFDAPLSFIMGRAAILTLTISTCQEAARLKQEIRLRNSKFGLADAIHLATAYEQKAMLLTTDNDFNGVDNALLLRKSK